MRIIFENIRYYHFPLTTPIMPQRCRDHAGSFQNVRIKFVVIRKYIHKKIYARTLFGSLTRQTGFGRKGTLDSREGRCQVRLWATAFWMSGRDSSTIVQCRERHWLRSATSVLTTVPKERVSLTDNAVSFTYTWTIRSVPNRRIGIANSCQRQWPWYRGRRRTIAASHFAFRKTRVPTLALLPDILTYGSCGYPMSSKVGIILQIRPRPSPYTYFPRHYSLIVIRRYTNFGPKTNKKLTKLS